jgi:hypothetical protein
MACLPRLTRAAKQRLPSRPELAPHAELACRARSRGQPGRSVDCRCVQPSCRSTCTCRGRRAPRYYGRRGSPSLARFRSSWPCPGRPAAGARNRPHACARSATAERLLSCAGWRGSCHSFGDEGVASAATGGRVARPWMGSSRSTSADAREGRGAQRPGIAGRCLVHRANAEDPRLRVAPLCAARTRLGPG